MLNKMEIQGINIWFLSKMMFYFVRGHTDCANRYSRRDFFQMLDFLIYNIFVESDGRVFQQTAGIPMGTNCAPLLADLYSYEAKFVQIILYFIVRYIDDVCH